MEKITKIDEFAEALATIIREKSEDLNVQVQKVRKNNDIEKTALVINTQSVGRHIGPTVYLNDMHQRYLHSDMTLEAVATDLVERLDEHLRNANMFDISVFETFEAAKDRIICRLVNAETNTELLENAPHKQILDFAVTYHVMVDIADANDDSVASARITNEMLKNWGVSVEDVAEVAEKNTKERLGVELCGLNAVIARMLGCTEEELDEQAGIDDCFPVLVLTNKTKMHGAYTMLDTTNLEAACDKLGTDLLGIIPSSIHEVLLCDLKKIAPAGLFGMISEVNRTEVAPEEVLSDNLYQFDRNSMEITIAQNADDSMVA